MPQNEHEERDTFGRRYFRDLIIKPGPFGPEPMPEGFEVYSAKVDLPARLPASSAGPNRAAAGRDDERGR